jgi:lactoylglutathione lyase
MHLSHVRLLVTHFDECFRFYRDVMAFQVAWGEERSGYADFVVGDGPAPALFARDAMAETVGTSGLPLEAVSQDRVALIIHTGDLEATVARLRERGAEEIVEPRDHPEWGIRTAYVRDPDGTLIELNTPLASSVWTKDLRDEVEKYTER